MSFQYKAMLRSHAISSTKESLLANNAVGEQLLVRMIHLHNTSGSTSAVVQLYFVPENSGVGGTWNADDRIYYKTLAPNDTVTLEFPVPGLMLEYLDCIEGICDQDQNVNCTITGGREY